MSKKLIPLDVHSEWSQMGVVEEETGEVILEMKVRTDPEELRRVIGGIPGPKKVIFEEGPMSGMIKDALEGVVSEVVSCDPTRNALIARAEESDDRLDTRRLAVLCRNGSLHEVYVPPEPYRTLRSLVRHDRRLARDITRSKNSIKALYHRQGIACRGVQVYRAAARKGLLKRLPSAALRWQMESAYRQLDFLRAERVGAHRVLVRQGRGLAVIRRQQSIPGVGPVIARTLVAWVGDPSRFKSMSALSAYAGLGLGKAVTNWQVVRRDRASKRGQRDLKAMLFIAAKAAIKGDNALAKRYQARLAAGWEPRKAIRDIARHILFIACALWTGRKEYQDALVKVPSTAQPSR
jgi:transposase